MLVPHGKHERDNHQALCRILKQVWDINLSLKDFCSNSGDDTDPLYTVNPLGCVQVRDQNRLLVVTCDYALGGKAEVPCTLEIAPESIGFHLIEAIGGDGPPSDRAAAELLEAVAAGYVVSQAPLPPAAGLIGGRMSATAISPTRTPLISTTTLWPSTKSERDR